MAAAGAGSAAAACGRGGGSGCGCCFEHGGQAESWPGRTEGPSAGASADCRCARTLRFLPRDGGLTMVCSRGTGAQRRSTRVRPKSRTTSPTRARRSSARVRECAQLLLSIRATLTRLRASLRLPHCPAGAIRPADARCRRLVLAEGLCTAALARSPAASRATRRRTARTHARPRRMSYSNQCASRAPARRAASPLPDPAKLPRSGWSRGPRRRRTEPD